MKQLLFVFLLASLIILVYGCQSSTAPEAKRPIGDFEQTELFAFVNEVDSLSQHASELPMVTRDIQPGFFIISDSLAEAEGLNHYSAQKTEEKLSEIQHVVELYDIEVSRKILNKTFRFSSYSLYLLSLQKVEFLIHFQLVKYIPPGFDSKQRPQFGSIVSAMEIIDLKQKEIVKIKLLSTYNSPVPENELRNHSTCQRLKQLLYTNYIKNRSSLLTELTTFSTTDVIESIEHE